MEDGGCTHSQVDVYVQTATYIYGKRPTKVTNFPTNDERFTALENLING